MKKDVFLFLMLIASPLRVDASESEEKYKIRIIGQTECLATLASYFAPESAIAAGLGALDQINHSRTPSVTCLEEVLTFWQERYPAHETSPDEVNSKMTARLKKLGVTEYCFNPWSEGSYDHKKFLSTLNPKCHGKTTPTDELEAAKAEKLKLRRMESSLHNLPEAFRLSYIYPSEKLTELKVKLSLCRPNPGTPGSHEYSVHEKKLAESCGGTPWSPEERTAGELLVAKLESQARLEQENARPVMEKIEKIFGGAEQADAIFERLDSIFPAIERFVCTRSGPIAEWWQISDSTCPGGAIGREYLQANRESMLNALGDLSALTEKVKAEINERRLTAERLERQAEEASRRNYEGERILLRLQAFLNKGGDLRRAADFCRQNEQDQIHDRKLANIDFEDGENIPIRRFQNSVERKLAGKFGVTEGELGAVNSYIGNFYEVINPALHKKRRLTSDLDFYRRTLNGGLAKLPPFSGTVTRFANLSPELLREHQVGAVITYDAFTSTSKAKDWKWSGNTKFVIYSRLRGKDLSEINESEQEVLFPSGTRFKVLAREKTGDTTKIVLAEIGSRYDASTGPARRGKKRLP